jgi:glucosamine-6-phosphate deaminase
MNIHLSNDQQRLGIVAGSTAAQIIREAVRNAGLANIILATGTSQFETLKQLIDEPGIDWGKVSMFHLDEYIGLPITHPASFRKYLQERFLSKVPKLAATYLINGESDAEAECERLDRIISKTTIDLALVGIGENGHLAFNDPPADFETEKPFLVVNLDAVCRKQQLGEGWFQSLEEVPGQAISMSIQKKKK